MMSKVGFARTGQCVGEGEYARTDRGVARTRMYPQVSVPLAPGVRMLPLGGMAGIVGSMLFVRRVNLKRDGDV